jgi:hypothetical protein
MNYPNLSNLSSRDDRPVPYEERLDEVVGGCKPTDAKGIACYDDWLMALSRRMLEHPEANTLVLLSVGKGVLELRAVKQLLAIRADNNQSAIRHLILIDPGLSDAHVAKAVTVYKDALAEVDVRYFTGDRAYDNALTAFLVDPQMRVAAIGALNFGYIMSTHHIHRNSINTMIALVELIKRRNSDSSTVYVVQAFQNSQGEYVLRDDTAEAFTFRFIPLLNDFTAMHLEEFYRRPGRGRV